MTFERTFPNKQPQRRGSQLRQIFVLHNTKHNTTNKHPSPSHTIWLSLLKTLHPAILQRWELWSHQPLSNTDQLLSICSPKPKSSPPSSRPLNSPSQSPSPSPPSNLPPPSSPPQPSIASATRSETPLRQCPLRKPANAERVSRRSARRVLSLSDVVRSRELRLQLDQVPRSWWSLSGVRLLRRKRERERRVSWLIDLAGLMNLSA